MSWRRTGCFRFPALVLVAAIVPSCGPSGTSVRPEGEPLPLKISHFRSYEDQRTKKLVPTYRAVMSYGWKDRVGESPRETLMAAAPRSAQYLGYAEDEKMARYVRDLEDFGIGKLIGVDPETLKPQELAALSQHPVQHNFHRVFTVGTDKGARSYYYFDHHKPGRERLLEIFLKCESYVVSVMQGYSASTRIWTTPVQTRDR
jgi:hypothetical protein